MKQVHLIIFAALFLIPALAHAADETVRVELNAGETADNRCRLTFVIENKGQQAVESLQLDLAVFNTEGVIHRRMLTEMAPVRAAKTLVRTFSVDGECKQIGSILVNEIAACKPGDPETCLEGLSLSSRLKGVKLYK